MSLIHKIKKRFTTVSKTVSESLMGIVIKLATFIVSDFIKMSNGMMSQIQ